MFTIAYAQAPRRAAAACSAQLLKACAHTAAQAFHGPTEAARIKERYRIRREIEELRRLGLTMWRPEELLGPAAASISSSSEDEASCMSAEASRDGSVAMERIGTHVSFQPAPERALPWPPAPGAGDVAAAVSPRLLVVEESPRGEDHGDVALGAIQARAAPAVAGPPPPAVPAFLAPAPGSLRFHGRGRRTRSPGPSVLRADLVANQQAALRASRQQRSPGRLAAPPRGARGASSARQQFGTPEPKGPRKARAPAAVAPSPRAVSADTGPRLSTMAPHTQQQADDPAPCASGLPQSCGDSDAVLSSRPDTACSEPGTTGMAECAANADASADDATPHVDEAGGRMSAESQRLIARAEAVLSQSRSTRSEQVGAEALAAEGT